MSTTKNFFMTHDGAVDAPSVPDNVWAHAHDASPGHQASTVTPSYLFARLLSGSYSIEVDFLTVDTSALTSGVTISAATHYQYVSSKAGTSSPAWNICSSTHTDTPVIGDFALRGATLYSIAIAQASITTSAYDSWVFNATGLAAISKTGLTKYCLREVNYDLANTAPTTDSNTYIAISMISATGTSQDPYIAVTYKKKTRSPGGGAAYSGGGSMY